MKQGKMAAGRAAAAFTTTGVNPAFRVIGSVPEPTTSALLIAGALAVLLRR